MNFIGSREETNRLEKLMGLVLGKADVTRKDNIGRASLDLTLGHQSALGRTLHPSNGDLSQEHVFIEVKTDLGFTASDLGAASEGLHDFVQIFFSSSEVENVFLEILSGKSTVISSRAVSTSFSMRTPSRGSPSEFSKWVI